MRKSRIPGTISGARECDFARAIAVARANKVRVNALPAGALRCEWAGEGEPVEARVRATDPPCTDDLRVGIILEGWIVGADGREYLDRRRDYWSTKVIPALMKVSLSQWERESGKSRQILIDARRGRRRPHRRNQELLISVARKLGLL